MKVAVNLGGRLEALAIGNEGTSASRTRSLRIGRGHQLTLSAASGVGMTRRPLTEIRMGGWRLSELPTAARSNAHFEHSDKAWGRFGALSSANLSERENARSCLRRGTSTISKGLLETQREWRGEPNGLAPPTRGSEESS